MAAPGCGISRRWRIGDFPKSGQIDGALRVLECPEIYVDGDLASVTRSVHRAYVAPTYFSFTRDRDRLKDKGRVLPSPGEITFDYEDAERGLEIAQMLKA